jgi:hypothetical protein
MRKGLLTTTLLLVILLGFQSTTAHADKRLGISHPDYDQVNVLPNQAFSGTFTVFNMGSDNVTSYVEIRGAPGLTKIEWAVPALAGGDLEWVTANEWNITAGTYMYTRFNIQLGEIIQGQWYNWSMVIGYVEDNPNPHAVAANGIKINMIYPKPPAWYEKIPWLWVIAGIGIGASAFVFIRRIRRSIRNLRDLKPYEPQIGTTQTTKKN